MRSTVSLGRRYREGVVTRGLKTFQFMSLSLADYAFVIRRSFPSCVCVCVFRWTVNTIGDMRGFPLPYTQNYDASGICSLFHHRQRHGTSEVIALSLSHVKHTEGAWYSAVHKVVFNSTVASLFAFFLYYSETAIS